MRTIKKNLSLLLAAAMLLSMCVAATSVSAAEPTKLLELDMSELEAESLTPSANSGEVTSGITKSGSLAQTTTLSFSVRPDGENGFTKESFLNANNDTTFYLDYYDKMIWPNITQVSSYVNHTMNLQFNNKELESADNTISFWVDVTPSHYLKQILCYRVDYTKNGTSSVRSFDLGINPDGTWNAFSEAMTTPDVHSPVTAGAFNVPEGWKHVVITNPVVVDDSKTMNVYVNGEFKKSVTLDIPADATVDRANVSFFGKSKGEEEYWRARWHNAAAGTLGGIKVYDGVMSDRDVSDLYKAQLPEFTYAKLIDLDFSTYVKDDSSTDPNNVPGSVGNVTNNGLLSGSTVLKFKSEHGRWCKYDLALESLENVLGTTTYYLHKTVGIDYCTDGNRFSTIIEKGLEEQENTISFWANYVPVNRTGVQWNILDYSAEYGGKPNVLFSLNQAGTTKNEFHLVGRWETPNYGDLTNTGVRKWAHYVVTNPKYTLNSETGKYEKTMSVYVNGLLKGSKTVTKPEGELGDAKLAFAGEAVNPGASSGINWPTNISFGGIKVYKGVLSGSEIKERYNNELPLYNETIKFVNDKDEKIESFKGLSKVTLKYTPKSDEMLCCYAACYDENNNMLFVDSMEVNEASELEISIKDGTSIVKGFVWDVAEANRPLRKACVLKP